ncbi:MAG: transposase [Gemmataceae bacterium]|nr:transposase [Gemmataceae bacterium]
MPNYIRSHVPGGTFFFTMVTYNRRPILTSDSSRRLLRESIRQEQSTRPFNLFATVLLPDHWHWIGILPERDSDYSSRIRRIKERFTEWHLASGGAEEPVSRDQLQHRARGVWQPRFWEHTVRDEDDLKRCVDYIHWNPVKHGFVERPKDYPWSSFHRFVKLGEYPEDWGAVEPRDTIVGAEWD